MRTGAILATALAGLFCIALCALFVWLVGRVGFMGALVTGIAVLFVTYMVELEDGTPIGSSSTPGLFASQRKEPPASPEKRAALWAEHLKDLDAISIAKHVGAALVTIGALGFFLLQL
jgi:hypothetical protein